MTGNPWKPPGGACQFFWHAPLWGQMSCLASVERRSFGMSSKARWTQLRRDGCVGAARQRFVVAVAVVLAAPMELTHPRYPESGCSDRRASWGWVVWWPPTCGPSAAAAGGLSGSWPPGWTPRRARQPDRGRAPARARGRSPRPTATSPGPTSPSIQTCAGGRASGRGDPPARPGVPTGAPDLEDLRSSRTPPRVRVAGVEDDGVSTIAVLVDACPVHVDRVVVPGV
jgi:hypothetical protein